MPPTPADPTTLRPMPDAPRVDDLDAAAPSAAPSGKGDD